MPLAAIQPADVYDRQTFVMVAVIVIFSTQCFKVWLHWRSDRRNAEIENAVMRLVRRVETLLPRQSEINEAVLDIAATTRTFAKSAVIDSRRTLQTVTEKVEAGIKDAAEVVAKGGGPDSGRLTPRPPAGGTQ
jgi:hypothetical protein